MYQKGYFCVTYIASFATDVSSLALSMSNFQSFSLYLLHILLLYEMAPVSCNFSYAQTVFMRGSGASENVCLNL